MEIGKDREGQEQRPDVRVIPPKRREADSPQQTPAPLRVPEKVGV